MPSLKILDRDENEKMLILTVGLPRSGKTTWAKFFGSPVVNPDAIRLAIHGQRFIKSAEPLVWSIVEIMINSLYNYGENIVVLDATNINCQSRNRWNNSFTNKKYITYFKVFDTPLSECYDRAINEERQDLISVIERMSEQFEPLTEDELKLKI